MADINRQQSAIDIDWSGWFAISIFTDWLRLVLKQFWNQPAGSIINTWHDENNFF